MHFTYDELNATELFQGDILKRTVDLDRVLKEVHPHFAAKDSNRLFCVLTQSCDLVRRNGARCSARYITVAAVRPLDIVVVRELESYLDNPISAKLKLIEKRRRAKAEQFLERLFNNNEDDYFYLRKEADLGMPEDHCVFLKLSIPLKSEVNYQMLLDAKMAQLTESFQHKLGYLVGKSYSRIGTQDWVPDNIAEPEFKRMVGQVLDEKEDFLWVDDRVFAKTIKELQSVPIDNVTIQMFQEIAARKEKEKAERKEEFLSEAERILLALNVDPAVTQKARLRMGNSAVISGLLR